MNTINLTENKKHIILHNIGDISIDYHIMTNIDYRSTINFPLITGGSTYVQEGGAWFTSFLLKEMKEELNTTSGSVGMRIAIVEPNFVASE